MKTRSICRRWSNPEAHPYAVDVLASPYQNPIQYLIHALETGEPVTGPLSPALCRIGQQIVDTAVLSAREKRAVLASCPESLISIRFTPVRIIFRLRTEHSMTKTVNQRRLQPQQRKPRTRPSPRPIYPIKPRNPKAYRPNIGLIACGGITETHLRAYKKAGYNVVALCDLIEERAGKRQEEFFPDADSLHRLPRGAGKRDDIEVVDIATHPARRVPLDRSRAQGGQARSQPEAVCAGSGYRRSDWSTLAERAGRRLAVNQNGRWAPHFSYIRQAVASRSARRSDEHASGRPLGSFLDVRNAASRTFMTWCCTISPFTGSTSLAICWATARPLQVVRHPQPRALDQTHAAADAGAGHAGVRRRAGVAGVRCHVPLRQQDHDLRRRHGRHDHQQRAPTWASRP